jgi:hypothetical protein
VTFLLHLLALIFIGRLLTGFGQGPQSLGYFAGVTASF